MASATATTTASRITDTASTYIPVAGVVWLLLALVLVFTDTIEFSLNEPQTRPELEVAQVEAPETEGVVLNVLGQFFFGNPNADMLSGGASQSYDSREEGLAGSELAQMIFESDDDIIGLQMAQDRVTVAEEVVADGVFEDDGAPAEDEEVDEVTATEGRIVLQLVEEADVESVVEHVDEAVNTYFPRTELAPDFWVMTVEGSDDTVLSLSPLNTGIKLLWFVVAFAVVETVIGFLLHGSGDKLIRPLVRAAGVFFVVWSFFGHISLWDYILNIIFPTSSQLFHPSNSVVGFAADHIELVLVSSLITVPLGLLIGILVTREEYRDFLPLANSIVNSGQTIPTLAIVAIMAPIIGFGFWPAIIALIAYGLLPVVRNTITGLAGVDPFIIDSAKGMGMTNNQILFQIEIPIASRIIMAGIRTSLVVNVGTATLGAFVGSGGLGVPITSGLSTTTYALVLLGALPAALLAILIDYILGRVEFVLTPKGLQIEQ